MLQALIFTAALAVGSFAAAGVLVFVLVRAIERLNVESRAADRRPSEGGHARGPRRFRGRREPKWWPEFERAFADYVRTSARRES